MSDVIDQIFTILSQKMHQDFGARKDIEFLADEKLYLDRGIDFYARGIYILNIKLKPQELIISERVEINVSGAKGGEQVPWSMPDRKGCGEGRPGACGTSGFSGGNVCIMSTQYTNLDNLVIITNGGDGMVGQCGQDAIPDPTQQFLH